MAANHSTASTLLSTIDISKYRHEVLISILGKKRRCKLTITNTLASYGLPARIGFKATGNYHRTLAISLVRLALI